MNVFTLLKLLVGSGFVTGALKAKFQAAKQAATIAAGLAAVALVAAIVGSLCIAAAVFFALRPMMADYQAALAVGGGFICIAGIVVLAAIVRVRQVMSGRQPVRSTAPALASARSDDGGQDGWEPLVRLLTNSLQSPVVLSALAMGIVAGRVSKRGRRD